jgi:hypothetical protein
MKQKRIVSFIKFWLKFKLFSDLKDAFAIFDKNNDGYIKKAEMKDILISLGKDGTNEQIERVIAEFDTDGKLWWPISAILYIRTRVSIISIILCFLVSWGKRETAFQHFLNC